MMDTCDFNTLAIEMMQQVEFQVYDFRCSSVNLFNVMEWCSRVCPGRMVRIQDTYCENGELQERPFNEADVLSTRVVDNKI